MAGFIFKKSCYLIPAVYGEIYIYTFKHFWESSFYRLNIVYYSSKFRLIFSWPFMVSALSNGGAGSFTYKIYVFLYWLNMFLTITVSPRFKLLSKIIIIFIYRSDVSGNRCIICCYPISAVYGGVYILETGA